MAPTARASVSRAPGALFPESRAVPGAKHWSLARSGGAGYYLQCPRNDSGQNGLDGAGDAAEYPPKSQKPVALEELRSFLRDLVDASNLREAERSTGVGHEAIRKFVDGTTKTPHNRSLRAFIALYWRVKGLAAVAETPAQPEAWELRSVLPAGLRPGLEALERAIPPDPATGERSEEAARIHDWLVWRLNFEHGAAGHQYKKRKKPRR